MPDAVVTDLSMPEMDGLDLAKRMRSDDRLSGVPIVLWVSLALRRAR
jgi:CheY-like chemotaxis protein